MPSRGLAAKVVSRRSLPRQLLLTTSIATALISPLIAFRVSAQTDEQWLGVASSDITDSANWSAGIPLYAQFGDTVINGGQPNQPVWTINGPSASADFYTTGWQLASLSIGDGSVAGGAGLLTVNGDPNTGATGNSGSGYFGFQSFLKVGANGGTGTLTLNLRPDAASPGTELGLAGGGPQGVLVGLGAGSSGTVNLLGSGKTVQSQNSYVPGQLEPGLVADTQTPLLVGSQGGHGVLNVQDAGWAVSAYSQGTGTPSFGIGVGAGSQGTLNVLSGGKFGINTLSGSTTSPDVIGADGGVGVLNVSGVNAGGYASNANFGDGLYIGSGTGGSGSVNVLAGGKFLTKTNLAPTVEHQVPAQVGVQGGTGTVTVDGAGSVWYVAGIAYANYTPTDGTEVGDLQVGPDGTGMVTISNGGLLALGAAQFSSHNDPDPPYASWTQLDSFDGGLGTLYLADTASGVGTLNIGAPAGQGAVAPGELEAAQIVFGLGAGTVVFNHNATDYTFTTPLVGTGTLAVYSGTTFLSPAASPPAGAPVDNSGFTGTTQLYGGALGLNYDAALGSSNVQVLGTAGLIYANAVNIGNAIDIQGGATLNAEADSGATATQAGVISGAGTLAKIGSGTLDLTAVNTLTGETDVTIGVLALVGSGSLESSSRVVADGTFDISAVDPVANIRSLAGSGVVNVGANTLNLTAADDTFAGAFTGTGVFALSAGTETLTGDSSGYTGSTQVNGGTLWDNGTLGGATSPATVASGGTLGGSGTLGGDVTVESGGTVEPGPATHTIGTLTINGNLALSSGSALTYDFGQPNVVGAPLNDLIEVGGNLTLGGTLNVSEAVGGHFEIGVYRVIDYNGTLTDNGLALGTVPVTGLSVQTAVPQQVNLVYAQPPPVGPTLSFWDGAAGPKSDGVVNGGDGSWQNSAGNNNWTNENGTVNAPFADGSFAIFEGAPGKVTVDNSLGAVTAAGMQFAVDGYQVSGGAITLIGAQALIRVGDGTSDSVNYVSTIAAPLIGSAELVKDDVGTLVLSAANTYSGGTRIQGGILQVSSDTNLGDAAGGLTFAGGELQTTASMTSNRAVAVSDAGIIDTDPGTTLTLGGAISGSGTLTKIGTGTLDVSNGGSFTGPTNVMAGILSVDGSLPGALVTMAGGTTLIGDGTVGATTLQSGSIIAPGHSIGTLTVQGNYLQNANAIYQVQLDPASANADLINVNGTAALAPGAALQVSRVSNAPYSMDTRYTVLAASDGLTGTFTLSGDTAVSAFAALYDTYDADHAYLQVEQTRSLDDAACTRNPHAAAGGLESVSGNNSALNAILIGSATDADACHALGQLSGEAYASMRGVFIDDSRFLREAVSYRMRGDSDLATPQTNASSNADPVDGVWGHAFGSWGDYDAHNDTATLSRNIGGFFIGADRDLGSVWRLGVVGGYSHTDFDVDSLNSAGSSDDYHLGVYTGNDQGPWLFHGGVAYTWHDVSMDRHPSYPGYQADLSSNFHAGTEQAWGEVAYDMPGRDASLQPFFNAAYVRLRTDGFAEQGDPASALSGTGESSSNTFSTLGARLTVPLNFADYSSLELRASAGWRHAYG